MLGEVEWPKVVAEAIVDERKLVLILEIFLASTLLDPDLGLVFAISVVPMFILSH